MANYVKFKQGLKKDFNTTNQPLTNGMIYFVIDENNNGSIYSPEATLYKLTSCVDIGYEILLVESKILQWILVSFKESSTVWYDQFIYCPLYYSA